MLQSKISIENERLQIRGLKDADLDGLIAMRNDPKIYRFEPTFLLELQGTAEGALRAIQDMDLEKDRQLILGIFEKTDPDTLAGLAEFYDYKPSGKVISIGYRLRPEFWGRGIASCCGLALLGLLEDHTAVELVTAHVMCVNKASSRSVLKCGFEHLITKPEDWGNGAPVMTDVYALDLPRDSTIRR